MKAYVITITDNERSVKSAKRCIKSAAMYGLEVNMWPATTPRDDPYKIFEVKGIPDEKFEEKYSRKLNCMSAFLSHHSLWEESVLRNENIVIYEHDAFVTGMPPVNSNFQSVITFSKPSYGNFITPSTIGVNPLTQKRYFGGAHGYIVKPHGAKMLIEAAKKVAGPTDVFLNLEFFPSLEEFFPWTCEARDDFSTIQNEMGVQSKHNFQSLKSYGIEDVK